MTTTTETETTETTEETAAPAEQVTLTAEEAAAYRAYQEEQAARKAAELAEWRSQVNYQLQRLSSYAATDEDKLVTIAAAVGVEYTPNRGNDGNLPKFRYQHTQRVTLLAQPYDGYGIRGDVTTREGALAVANGWISRNEGRNGINAGSGDAATVDRDSIEWLSKTGEWVSTDVFFGTPAPVEEAEKPVVPETLPELKALLRRLAVDLLRTISETAICVSGRREAFTALDLGEYPRKRNVVVEVPVAAATARLSVAMFPDDTDENKAAAIEEVKQRFAARLTVRDATYGDEYRVLPNDDDV